MRVLNYMHVTLLLLYQFMKSNIKQDLKERSCEAETFRVVSIGRHQSYHTTELVTF
jgi:hypothetical protein